MLVFVETTSASTFSIVLDPYDRVLDIKKKIEKSQGIDVSTQELYYKGEALLMDDLDLKTCNIVNYSRILLVLPDEDNYQVLPQTEQAPTPSNYITNIEDSLGNNQGCPSMVSSNKLQMLHQTEHSQVTPSNEDEAFFNKDWPPMARSNDDQPDKSSLDSFSIEELLNLVPETPLTDQEMRKMQGFWSASTTVGNVNIQESSGRNDNNQDLLQRDSSNTFGNFSFSEDCPLSTERFTNIQSTSEEIINKNQTEKSTVPSNPYGDFSFIEFPLSSERHSDLSYFPAITTGDNINKDQELQTEQTPVPSNSFGDVSFLEYPLSTERFTDTSYSPAITTGDIINENQVLQTGQTSVASNSTKHRNNTQDLPVRVGRSNQMVERETSPPIIEVINIPDSPVKVSNFKKLPPKLRVMVLPYSREKKPVSKFPVNVNASENVEELRKELEKIQQRTQLNLPQEGYFFMHKQRVLDDDQSFHYNGVTHGDTIEIFPGHVTKA